MLFASGQLFRIDESKQADISLMILDLIMPEMGGKECSGTCEH